MSNPGTSSARSTPAPLNTPTTGGRSTRFAPLSSAAGVELLGADLAGLVSDDLQRAIAAALEEHPGLVVRDQSLSNDNLVAFARMFGPVEAHYVLNADGSAMSPVHQVSNLDELGKPNSKPF